MIYVGSMMVDMLDIVEELETWEVGVGLILRGAENKSNIFCSGGDLRTVEKISGDLAPQPFSVIIRMKVVRMGSGCQFS